MRSKGKWLSSLALAIVSAPSTTALQCTQYFPFTTFPHDEQNKGIVDIFLWYIYLLHCRRNKLVRIIQFQVIFLVGVELFSAKLFLLFFYFFALFSQTFAFIYTIYNFFLWYIPTVLSYLLSSIFASDKLHQPTKSHTLSPSRKVQDILQYSILKCKGDTTWWKNLKK